MFEPCHVPKARAVPERDRVDVPLPDIGTEIDAENNEDFT